MFRLILFVLLTLQCALSDLTANERYRLMLTKRSSFGKPVEIGSDHCAYTPFPPNRRQMIRMDDAVTENAPLVAKNSKLIVKNDRVELVHTKTGENMWFYNYKMKYKNPMLRLTQTGLVIEDDHCMEYIFQTNLTEHAALTLHDNCNLALFESAPFSVSLWETATGMCFTAHVVTHSHDDVGWLLPPGSLYGDLNGYYNGCGYANHGVRAIIGSMVEALYRDSKLRFSQVETFFFHRWWNEQDDETKKKARHVVKNGQLHLVNTGWSMHDEACVHQESAIANMARGVQFMREAFGNTQNTTIGWHIDPFGHASTTPRLMAQMGYNAFFFQRQDFQQRDECMAHKLVETMWDSSNNLGSTGLMFTSIMFDGYCSGCLQNKLCPSPFCCYKCGDMNWDSAPMEFEAAFNTARKKTTVAQVRSLFGLSEDSGIELDDIADTVVETYKNYAGWFRTDQVLIPWGCDFEHNDAFVSFALMNSIMDTIKTTPKYRFMTVKYSTPQDYIDAIVEQNYSWPVNHYDYFLDSDNWAGLGYGYWSGYPSSRMEYKRFERDLMHRRSSAEMLLSTVRPEKSNFKFRWDEIDFLRQAMGIAQHHDSITGTAREFVRNDYDHILTHAFVNADNAMTSILEEITKLGNIQTCPLANISRCPVTENLNNTLAVKRNVSVILYNSRQQTVKNEILRIPIPVKNVKITLIDIGVEQNISFTFNVQPSWNLTNSEDPTDKTSMPPMGYEIVLSVDMPPLSVGVLKITPHTQSEENYIPAVKLDKPINLSNEYYNLVVDPSLGLTSVENIKRAVKTNISVEYLWYCPKNNTYGQASGAYILKTCTNDEKPVPFQLSYQNATYIKGTPCQEVRLFGDNKSHIHQTIRICKGQNHFHVLTGIGELDPGKTGKEAIIRYKTDLVTNGTFYTDSEGLELQERRIDMRPNYMYNALEHINANFFPSNQWMMIKNDTHALALVSDSSRSVSSMNDGEISQLIMRRLLFDDSRGVSQALNESIRVISDTIVIFDSVEAAVEEARLSAVSLTHPPLPFYCNHTARNIYGPVKQDVRMSEYKALPENVHLHSREMLDENTMIIRYQHLFSVDESNKYSKPVIVDIKDSLPKSNVTGTAHIVNVTEMDLNGVIPLEDINKRRLQYRVCDIDSGMTFNGPTKFELSLFNKTKVMLKPMDIRTFKVKIVWNKAPIKL